MNILETHKKLTEWFERRGVESSRFASEIIISRTLEVPRVHIYAGFDRVMKESELEAIRERGKRLVAGEPIQLIVGDCQFLSHFFKVKPGVFIPRPETEQLALIAAEFFNSSNDTIGRKFLDLCSGTGVISISLLKSFPDMTAIGVDISETAVALSNHNADTLGVSDRVSYYQGDMFSPVAAEEKFAAIVSNPPYIPTGDIESLDPIVKDYDPALALNGGIDGNVYFAGEKAKRFRAGSGFRHPAGVCACGGKGASASSYEVAAKLVSG
jgi:release factor glutamine methyltransferase